MADFAVTIHERGTSQLELGTELSYNEAQLLRRAKHGFWYSASLKSNANARYSVFIPHQRADEELAHSLAWMKRLSRFSPRALPPAALATHPMQAQSVLVLPYVTQSLGDALRDLMSTGQWVRAEKLATQSALDYCALVDALLNDDEPRNVWHWRKEDLGLDDDGRLCLTNWLGAQPVYTKPVDEAAYLHHWGRLWLESCLGQLKRLPLAPLDDTRWQARRIAYQPEGVLSLGWRLLLQIVMQTPPDYRFNSALGTRHSALARALNAWLAFITLPSSSLDSQSPELLDEFLEQLPSSFKRPNLRNALWHDWQWRARLGDTLNFNRREGYQQARLQAFSSLRMENDERSSVLDSLRPLLQRADWQAAQAFISQWRSYAEGQARTSNSAHWETWGHLGRWERIVAWLSAYPEHVESAWAIGEALHQDPQEDDIRTLDAVREQLVRLPDDKGTREWRFEADLRTQLSELRQQTPLTEWQTHADALRSALFSIYNGEDAPPYLQMAEAMQGDSMAFFYTLLGRMVGSVADSLEPILAALRTQDWLVARWLMERAPLLTARASEEEWLHQALAPYSKFLNFMQAPLASPSNLPTQFAEGLRLLHEDAISRYEELSQALEQRLLAIGAESFSLIQNAVQSRHWQDLSLAYPALRIHSESASKEVLERLTALYAEQPRRLDYYDTLDHYRRLYSTYRDLLQMAHTSPLWRETTLKLKDNDLRQHAKQLLELLKRALELGIPMNDILHNDDNSREQWRQMLTDALSMLGRLDTLSGDVETLKAQVGGEAGIAQRVQDLMQALEALRTQVDNPDGQSGALGLQQQLSALRMHLNELERTYADQVRQLRQSQDEVRGQIEISDIQLKRQASQLSGTGNLIEDARQRLLQLESQVLQTRKHEAQVLSAYLDALPDATSLDRIPNVLDTIDSMVYAMRRCPTDAFDELCHETWMHKFNAFKARFDALSAPNASINRSDRRALKGNIRQIRAMLGECEDEARNKLDAYRRINLPPDSKG